MALHADWLEWMWEQRSDVWIAEKSGIPRSTIGFVRRGERELGSQYWKALRSAYQSETIGRLNAIGMPSRESFRYSLQPPTVQRRIESEFSYIRDQLAANSTAIAYERSGMPEAAFPWQATYDAYHVQVTDSIHNSPFTYDDIKERYGITALIEAEERRKALEEAKQADVF